MCNTLQDLKEAFPEYWLTINRMNRDGFSFEEIEDHLTDLSELDSDELDSDD
jgi:hypothetical protein